MVWAMIVGVAVAACAAGAVVPFRNRLGAAAGFPWFWAAFPVTCLACAAWVGASLDYLGYLGGSGRFFWGAFTAPTAQVQFLGTEQLHDMQRLHRLRQVLPFLAAAGAALSVWTWRRRRF